MLAPENGNRMNVQDFVLIITDGDSQDEVEDEAKRLRNVGAMVSYVDNFSIINNYEVSRDQDW